jgi:hypothetical protein
MLVAIRRADIAAADLEADLELEIGANHPRPRRYSVAASRRFASSGIDVEGVDRQLGPWFVLVDEVDGQHARGRRDPHERLIETDVPVGTNAGARGRVRRPVVAPLWTDANLPAGLGSPEVETHDAVQDPVPPGVRHNRRFENRNRCRPGKSRARPKPQTETCPAHRRGSPSFR